MDFEGSVQVILERLNNLWVGFLEQVPNLLLALFVLALSWIAAAIAGRVVMKVAERSNLRRSLAVFFRKVLVAVVWISGIVAAAIVVFPSVTPGKMLSALGLGSVAIGFAFKDVFENFIAGMLILLREPFALGDFIECEEAEGFVEDITIRDTRLRQTDGQNVVLPNAMLFKNPVTVRTSGDLRRVEIVCGVGYDEDVEKSRSVIQAAVEAVDAVNDEKPVQVFAQSLGASSVDFQVAWWSESDPLSVRESRDQVIQSVKTALDKAGIEIPFPHRTLTFKDPLRLAQDRTTTANAA